LGLVNNTYWYSSSLPFLLQTSGQWDETRVDVGFVPSLHSVEDVV